MKQKAENIENIISREIKRTRRKIKIQEDIKNPKKKIYKTKKKINKNSQQKRFFTTSRPFISLTT